MMNKQEVISRLCVNLRLIGFVLVISDIQQGIKNDIYEIAEKHGYKSEYRDKEMDKKLPTERRCREQKAE